MVLPVLTVTLQFVGVVKCGLEYDQHRGEANKPHECHKDVSGGEV